MGNEFITTVNTTWEDLEQNIAGDFNLIDLIRPDEILSNQVVEEMILSFDHLNKTIMQIVEICSGFIFTDFKYIKGITTIESTVDEILEHRSGVCQDFAHVLLQLLRTMGIPSRYVSGYICPNKKWHAG